MKKLVLLFLIVILSLSACSDNEQYPTTINPSINNAEAIKPVGNISGNKDYFDEKNTIEFYDDLFDLNNKIELNFNISAEELYKIEKDYEKYPHTKCNIYRRIDSFEITITYPSGRVITNSISDVGIRMKGNTTRHAFVDNSGKMFSFSHFAISFQETFDDELDYKSDERITWNKDLDRENRKNRTFFGLRGLELKFNAEGDLSYTRDIYTSQIYRNYGIYAQNITLGVMNFNITNGKETKYNGTLGVYKIYEPIDRIYIKRYFQKEKNDGDLYKATWGSFRGMPDLNHKSEGVFGVDESSWDEAQSVSYDLKTNKTTSTQSDMRNLLHWINNNDSDLNETLSTYMDTEYFTTLMALMYLTGDWDNFMYDSNNYYLYFDNLNHKCYMMPYDMDKTFGIAAKNHDMDKVEPLDTMNLQGYDNRSRLLIKTIDIYNSTLQKGYLEKVKSLYKEVLNYDNFVATYNQLYEHYKDDIKPTLINLPASFDKHLEEKYFYHLIYAKEAGKYMNLTNAYGYSITAKDYFENKEETIKNVLG